MINKPLKILICADFTLDKTGVLSTARSILSTLDPDSFDIYSNQDVSILEKRSKSLAQFRALEHGFSLIVFTHIDFSGLIDLISKADSAVVHVGDWPLSYWISYIKASRYNWLKGALRVVIFTRKLRKLSRILSVPLIFVTNEDAEAAKKFGFQFSYYIPIGICRPNVIHSKSINYKEIVFTGNFRYSPNRNAALSIINEFGEFHEIKIKFAGYFANDFKGKANNLDCYENVHSVIDFLSQNRSIYYCPIRFGAGSKNKILEAIVSKCPVIATKESLDSSNIDFPSVYVIDKTEDVIDYMRQMVQQQSEVGKLVEFSYQKLLDTRGWARITDMLLHILKNKPQSIKCC